MKLEPTKQAQNKSFEPNKVGFEENIDRKRSLNERDQRKSLNNRK